MSIPENREEILMEAVDPRKSVLRRRYNMSKQCF